MKLSSAVTKAAVLGGALSAGAAHAAMDTAAAITAIEAVETPVAAVGAAVFALMVAIKAWKWLRRSL